ncbi:hypothetical protein CU048_03420 [Beijerinckiaceae bacterium]|nr:hypothetical protein CU048_03420 [Beijerinckiaceae bacterium]
MQLNFMSRQRLRPNGSRRRAIRGKIRSAALAARILPLPCSDARLLGGLFKEIWAIRTDLRSSLGSTGDASQNRQKNACRLPLFTRR